MTYIKGTLISEVIKLFPFCATGNFCALGWQSAVPAEVSDSNFSSNQKNNFF